MFEQKQIDGYTERSKVVCNFQMKKIKQFTLKCTIEIFFWPTSSMWDFKAEIQRNCEMEEKLKEKNSI